MNILRSLIVIALLLATSLPLHCQTVSNTLFDSSQAQADIANARSTLTTLDNEVIRAIKSREAAIKGGLGVETPTSAGAKNGSDRFFLNHNEGRQGVNQSRSNFSDLLLGNEQPKTHFSKSLSNLTLSSSDSRGTELNESAFRNFSAQAEEEIRRFREQFSNSIPSIPPKSDEGIATQSHNSTESRTNIAPVSMPGIHTEQKTHPTAADFPPEELQRMKALGVSPEDLVPATDDTVEQTETPQTVVWLDNFMGIKNAMLPVELITVKKGSLKFRFANKEYNVSGNFTVMLTMPRKHKNPNFGFGSPEKANFVILENVSDSLPSLPLLNATIWEKSTDFIDVEALGKEWIRSGTYTIQN